MNIMIQFHFCRQLVGFDVMGGNVRLSAPVDYVLSVNNTYSVLQRMGCIRHGADNRIKPDRSQMVMTQTK